jgi:pimeloyl-ACP methyl ester carboxylesterase
VVISHGIRQAEDRLPPEDVWQAQQRSLLNLSSNSRQVVAERSGHFIPLDQPDLVVDQIRRMVEAVQR